MSRGDRIIGSAQLPGHQRAESLGNCNGQGFVAHDILGMFERFTPRFVKKYADLSTDISHAFEAYVREVQAESFPTKDHAFHIKAEELTQAMAATSGEEDDPQA